MSKNVLALLPADALLLEPREVYDVALVGTAECPNDHWPRKEKRVVAVYSQAKCIEAIMRWMGCDESDAAEWFDFNTSGAWVGEGTPTFVD